MRLSGLLSFPAYIGLASVVQLGPPSLTFLGDGRCSHLDLLFAFPPGFASVSLTLWIPVLDFIPGNL